MRPPWACPQCNLQAVTIFKWIEEKDGFASTCEDCGHMTVCSDTDFTDYDEARRRFNALKDDWKKNRPRGLDLDHICMHEAYQQIIGMGKPAIKFICEELENEVDFWFWALHAITGENPIPDEDRGKMVTMKMHWLDWAKENGYIN